MITKKSLYFWVFHKNAKLQFILLGIILVTVAARLLPLEMQRLIVNEAIAMKDFQKLYLYCGIYFVSMLMANGLKYVVQILQSYIGKRSLINIRTLLFEHILSLPMTFFRHTSPGMVVSSLVSELAIIADFIGAALSTPLINILTFIAMMGYMVYLNPMLGVISIMIYPVEMIIIPLLQKRANANNRKRIQSMRDMSGMVTESISGIHEVHGNGSYILERDKFNKHAKDLYLFGFLMQVYKYGIKFVTSLFQSVGPFILFLIGGYLTIKGRFDLGALVAFLSAYERVHEPWKELMDFYQLFQHSKVVYKQIMGSFDLKPDYALVPEGREPLHFDGAVEVKEASYVVSGNIKLLDKVSLSLKPGEHMALVGFSGSGKSTLALVLGQLYKYTGGNVLIDGHEVGGLSKRDMATNIGIVAQQPFIFQGTVRENLLYSCEAMLLQDGECGGSTEPPELDTIIEVIQQTGLFLDVLRFGLRSVLDPEKDAELVAAIVEARKQFQEQRGRELEHDVEFFNRDRYVEEASVTTNITFGAPVQERFARETLHKNTFFLDFLETAGLRASLENLGKDIAQRTVHLIRDLGPSPEVFEESPINQDRFEEYGRLVDALDGSSPEPFPDKDRFLFLRLALRFTPARHKLVGVTDTFRQKIVEARHAFQEAIEKDAPGAFSFYNQAEFIPDMTIQDNILFGRIKRGSAGAEERVSQQLMQILILQNVLEPIVEYGLNFDVGSMGDRLSGGQRQKVALARTFLKAPPMLILDEATSALDNASQARIQNLMRTKWKGRSTLLAVVHRLDTLKDFDTVAVLKAGKIIEQGPYEELLARKGALYELVHGKK